MHIGPLEIATFSRIYRSEKTLLMGNPPGLVSLAWSSSGVFCSGPSRLSRSSQVRCWQSANRVCGEKIKSGRRFFAIFVDALRLIAE